MTPVERISYSFIRHCRLRRYILRQGYQKCFDNSSKGFRKVGSVSTNAVDEKRKLLFPELVYKTDTKRTLISIDPDSNGAITAFTWNDKSLPVPNATTCALSMLQAAEISVYDMPTETWQMRSREKKRPSPKALVDLFRSLQHESTIVCVAVESSTPTHLSGKFAWYDSGFSSGMLHGIFEALSLPSQRVPVSSWKKDLGLVKLGKPGSLALARALFRTHKEEYLRRKKDHGRAESMLIGAWALGVRPEDVDDWPDIHALIECDQSGSNSIEH